MEESRRMPEIIPLHLNDAAKWGVQLVELLQDAVDDGASVGFLAPLSAPIRAQFEGDVGCYSNLLSRPLGMSLQPFDER
jgi:hypothetical protein